MICKKCDKDISGDCVLTGRPDVEGVCVFCWYNTNTWDSNGELVTKDQATRGIGWFTKEDIEQWEKEKNKFKCPNNSMVCNQPYACDACPYNEEIKDE